MNTHLLLLSAATARIFLLFGALATILCYLMVTQHIMVREKRLLLVQQLLPNQSIKNITETVDPIRKRSPALATSRFEQLHMADSTTKSSHQKKFSVNKPFIPQLQTKDYSVHSDQSQKLREAAQVNEEAISDTVLNCLPNLLFSHEIISC